MESTYQKKKVSVIVPVYNTEKYLARCLHSICRQSYRNLEIILVNDGSTDGSADIIAEYEEKDPRILSVAHSENRGLFQARITGVKASSGDYVAFVDSDDWIGVDWFRLLVKKAEETDADIVFANTICEDEKKNRYIYNASYFAMRSRDCLCGEQVLDSLMRNEGMCFSMHTIWNKLYSRGVWESCLPDLEKLQGHLVMTEDIAFSVVLHFYARKLAYSDHDGYFYFRNSDSSTIAVGGLERTKKNITDVICSFEFVKNFLLKKEVFHRYEKNYQEFRDRYFRWWSYVVSVNTAKLSKGARQVRKGFLDSFGRDAFEYAREDDGFFTDATTPWNERYEELKKRILDEEISCVSFDIFDTLILRPFLEPADLFYFMEKDFRDVSGHDFSFREVRLGAERRCRREAQLKNPNCHDVTLSEIYGQMGRELGISREGLERLKEREEELELRFCTERRTGKELYELAYEAGKRIILISDMYLEEECVSAILQKNGYCLHERMFLSSAERSLKGAGALFEIAAKKCKLSPGQILHIGDNWEADYLCASRQGYQSCFIPKASDILFNRLGDIYTGDAVRDIFDNENAVMDASSIMRNPAARCLYALAANELFDNPFVSFHAESNYNRDAYLIGYFAVGMHLLGLGRWTAERAKKGFYQKVCFIARDGYLPKRVYDIIREYVPGFPPSEYVYASRKSMTAATIRQPQDLYGIRDHCDILSHSPESIYRIYQDVLVPLDDEVILSFQKSGIPFEKRFSSDEEFAFFIDRLIEISFDGERARQSLEAAGQYLKKVIGRQDATFDLGYSGRLQSAICAALQFPVNALYLHTNGFVAAQQARKQRYRIESYYDFEPLMSGVVNEYFLSDYGPSCVGYRMENGEAVPVFEEKEAAFQERFLLDEIVRGCERFVRDFYEIFGEDEELFDLRPIETSLPYERFLTNPRKFDLKLLKHCYLEDEYYGGISRKRLSEHWSWQLDERHAVGELQRRKIGGTVGEAGAPLYEDGVLVAAFRKINKLFPLGSRRREMVKKIAGTFVR